MSVTMARPRSASIRPRRSNTSSGSVNVTARDGRPYFLGRPSLCRGGDLSADMVEHCTAPIGNWQACAPLTSNRPALVECVHATIHPTNSVGDLEVVKRVAWLLRGEGGGLPQRRRRERRAVAGIQLLSDANLFPERPYLQDHQRRRAGGTNTPGYADNDFVDPSLYVPAIDPSKP